MALFIACMLGKKILPVEFFSCQQWLHDILTQLKVFFPYFICFSGVTNAAVDFRAKLGIVDLQFLLALTRLTKRLFIVVTCYMGVFSSTLILFFFRYMETGSEC